MRIVGVKHTFGISGCTTELLLTDDLLNSNPGEIANLCNTLLRATKIDFQDRSRGDLKARI